MLPKPAPYIVLRQHRTDWDHGSFPAHLQKHLALKPVYVSHGPYSLQVGPVFVQFPANGSALPGIVMAVPFGSMLSTGSENAY